MIFDVSQTISFLIAAILGLISCCMQFQNKRVMLQNNSFLSFIQFIITIYVIFEIYDPNYLPSLTILIVILVLVINYIIIYFVGTTYSVKTKQKELLIKSIDAAISSTLSSKAEREDDDDKTIFSISNSSGKIVLKDTETISGKHSYTIKFKKWKSRDLKKPIIKYIENELTNFDYVKPKRIRDTLCTILFVALVIGCIGLVSESVMKNEKYDLEKEKMPNELYFVNEDYNCNDKDIIKKIHNELQDLYALKDDKLTVDEINEKNNIEYIIEYGHGGNVIYMQEDRMYIYIKYSTVSDRSILHELCYRIHKIYDKSDGVFYRVWYDEELYNYIKDIIDQ
ncbi:hypothetical protein SH1V18_05780 [Vallitalea longa]|uniref:Uncharacterized protein n=1 Tax=Vallitalea longa TaxID=2936439 RepID=A0A9W6DE71_9FIRM|nr:hypothetical protein [Vallitalea longa]GKX28098.1 hypothetical protein SH1V18_05780 [Vallitalea longa]